jgi:hypothetical protein
MVVDKDAMIIADGTAEEPIIFTSQRRVSDPTNNLPYQWGGLTIIGNAEMTGQVTSYEVTLPRLFEPGSGNAADNSGILRNVHILNTGIGVGTGDTEINGLSLVAVGNGTIIEDVTVDYSGDDGIEIWGGTVNLTNIKISHCTDDHLDVDDGYSGTVKNFEINVLITGDELGYAGIEQSGQTYAHYEDFVINIMDQESEGGIFFKGTTIGGHFKNGTINYMSEASGAIYSDGDASTFIEDPSYTTIEGVTINAYPGYAFLNKNNDDTYSADEIENTFFFDGNSYGNTVEDL